MILCVFYDLLKDIQVIHYILDLGNEQRKLILICSIAMFKGDGESDQIFICEGLNDSYCVLSYFTSNL